jgi:hypothetical protein
MTYLMLQYDRPTDTQHWNEYNRSVRTWISHLLALPGAVSLMAYRTADGASPNTTALLEFRSLDEARSAAGSKQLTEILQELKSVGAFAKVLLVERSPFTPEPLLASS